MGGGFTGMAARGGQSTGRRHGAYYDDAIFFHGHRHNANDQHKLVILPLESERRGREERGGDTKGACWW